MRRAAKSVPAALLAAPAAALILIVFAYPVLHLLVRSFSAPQWGLQNYAAVFGKAIYLKVLWNTAAISAATAAVTLALGYPVAYTMARAGPGIRKLLIFAVLIPFWTSILVRIFAWMILLQPGGLINRALIGVGVIDKPLDLIFNRAGVLIGMVQVMLPFMIFPLFSVMTQIDRGYLRAAASLGAAPAKRFFAVYLPLTMPGVVTGTSLVFIISLGYFITPALLGGRRDIMVAQLIHERITELGDWGLASALAITLLAGVALLFGVSHRLLRAKDWTRA